jgi:hypothetical protein
MVTPIEFAPGSYGGIADGKVSTDGGSYSISATATQILTMIFGGGQTDGEGGFDNLGALVTQPDGTVLPNPNPIDARNPNFWPSGAAIPLPETGNYLIQISIMPPLAIWNGTFTLCILLVNPAPNI